jgi:hypothetical protein
MPPVRHVAPAAVGATFLVLMGLAIAHAASLSRASTSIAAGRVATPRCTSAGLLVVPNLSGLNVASVTVSSLPVGCGGATIHAAVNNGSTSSSGSATVPAGGGSVTVTLAAVVAATTAEQLDVLLIGP